MTSTATTRLGVDWGQLRALLRCYWRMNGRGKLATTISGRQKSNGLLFVSIMYAFVGLMTAGLAFGKVDVFTYSLLVHGMTFFVVGLAATSEAGEILFSINETDVLLHRPIAPRTLLLAKSLNLIGLTIFLAGSLNLFPTFLGLMTRGAPRYFPLVHLFSVVLLSVCCSAAVVCTYGLIIRLFDREKFDNFAAWTQVAMSVLFACGYQLLPGLTQRFAGMNLSQYTLYLLPLPPAWFAAIDSIGATGIDPSSIRWLWVTGVIVTFGLAQAALGRLAPSYGEALARLNQARQRPLAPLPAEPRTDGRDSPMLNWWLRDPVERASFRLAAAYMRRDRDVKLRLYPSLGVLVVIPLMRLVNPSPHNGFEAMTPLLMIWVLGLLPMSAMEALRISSHPLAADLFCVAPLKSNAAIFFGVRKATLFYLLLPALSISMVLIAVVLPGGWISLLLTLPGAVLLPTLSLLPGCIGSYLPLSQAPRVGTQASRNLSVVFLTMIPLGVLAGITYAAWKLHFLWVLVFVETIAVLIAHQYLRRHIQNRPVRAGMA